MPQDFAFLSICQSALSDALIDADGMTCVPWALTPVGTATPAQPWAQSMPDLCCVGTDLQLSCSQTCTLLKTLTQTLTHALTLLNLSQHYGPASRSMGCV